ncbi:MAG: hypothetical protein NZ926_00030 [Candidatus Methanomethylicia archaeon]|nr:hypothetical protein [Candidatus Methanomethylicia archaeon]MCX8168822.1 hypothetical protein [Candidatus Methanomethylicia archaeon]MDW7988554.1 hypothetical protein [Nitrososphaerota archaeon]
MVSEIREFKNVAELVGYLNKRVGEIVEDMKKYHGLLEDIKRRIETYGKFIEMMGVDVSEITKLQNRQEIDFYGVGIIVNPRPEREIELINEVLIKLNEELTALHKIRRALELLGINPEARINLQVLIVNDVPKKLIIKL